MQFLRRYDRVRCVSRWSHPSRSALFPEFNDAGIVLAYSELGEHAGHIAGLRFRLRMAYIPDMHDDVGRYNF